MLWYAMVRPPMANRSIAAVRANVKAARTRLPTPIRKGHCFTDFWVGYQAVIPDEQHTAVGKETGETVHVERWKNTLRQRLARFVRMTFSFSKSVVMHEACLLLFLHRSNRERATLLK